ncbi:MAG: hypothetical protein ACLFUT_08885 [Desulfobacteraceae bacterium]
MPHLLNNTLAPIDTSWFDADPEAYLTRPDFLEFQELAGIDLRDLFSMVGVICGLNDRAALTALKLAHRILGGGGGRIVVTSTNENMLDRDPLGSFIIQHIGSAHDPFHGWGLNCRSRETMYRLLEKAGFTQVQLFDDAAYPGRTTLLKKGLLTGVDPLPSKVMGHGSATVPLALPPPEERAIGFNHIAVAVKE